MDRSKEEGITVRRLEKLERDIKYLLPNSVLTSDIFDLENLTSVTNESVEELEFADDYDDIEENRARREKLEQLDPSIFPKDLFSNRG